MQDYQYWADDADHVRALASREVAEHSLRNSGNGEKQHSLLFSCQVT